MYCRNCGESMEANQAVCLKCGVKANKGNQFCSHCGQSVNPNASVCVSCGCELQNSDELAGKDKVTIIIICRFLGGLGIHNFMMGETKKGILRIIATCCFGLGYIFALIDLIKILTDRYEVNPDAFI